MTFNSLTYFYFLCLMFMIYWAVPVRYRTGVLLVGSFIFYSSWHWKYSFLLMACVAGNFLLSQKVYGNKRYLAMALIFNLTILGYYKYLGFFSDTARHFVDFFSRGHIPTFEVLLPLGVSFFTFHSMSYLIDVARGERLPEKNLLLFTLYICFWPHLVAGPILRSHEIIPQFSKEQHLTYSDLSAGTRRIVVGLFKKVVLADSLAGFIDEGFAFTTYPHNGALDNWVLAFAFGLQIYFDFSGYSDIALGSARLFGYRFPENFSFPYVVSSPRQFWRAWHITLSSWIRDYLYMPLQDGTRKSSTAVGGIGIDPETNQRFRRHCALFVTWGLMGFWHGANWTFILWGFWHAMLIFIFRGWSRLKDRAPALFEKISFPLSVGETALTICWIMAGWIFFRAQTVGQAFHMMGSFFNFSAYGRLNLHPNFHLITLVFFVGIYIVYFLSKYLKLLEYKPVQMRSGWVFRSLFYTFIVLAVVTFFRKGPQFIYFQF
jgi:alginate O-acetyltransferase complex protein AlgI